MPFLKLWIPESFGFKPEDIHQFQQTVCSAWSLSPQAVLVVLNQAEVLAGQQTAIYMEFDSFIPDPPQRRQQMAEALFASASSLYGIQKDQLYIRFSHIEGFARGDFYVS